MNSSLGITSLPDGQVQVSLTGVDWQRYSILQSSNLHELDHESRHHHDGRHACVHLHQPAATNGIPMMFFKSTLTN